MFPTTSLADAQRASRLFAEDQCARINHQLKDRYDSTFEAWKTMVNAGTVPNTDPPTPPLAWIPFTQADGYTYEQQGTALVCEARTDIPDDHTKHAPVEVAQLSAINVPPGDKRPVGTVISGVELMMAGADPREVGTPGSRWKKTEQGGPWGTWRWYARQ